MKFRFFIFATFSLFSHLPDGWEKFQQKMLAEQATLPGWCSQEKACRMAELIFEVHPKICVEIGVFGGASLYPTTAALQFLDHGKVYAIDSWNRKDALEGHFSKDPDYIWWSQIDLEKIFAGFLKLIRDHHLDPYCIPMRMRTDQAALYFLNASVDILHIDGNHASRFLLFDVETWLPKVKRGGYIWLNDAHLPSAKAAVEKLLRFCEKNPHRSTNECVLFRKK
ncbi:MAG: class I SAM-dependent methyltransferase [Verrucomicrobiota bacterium]|nr:class I SAM-dependent methyltransferase [Verrucomicrobiota bacterium]